MGKTNGITGFANLDSAEDTRRLELVHGLNAIEHLWLLGRVGLDAANPVRVGGVDDFEESADLISEETADSEGFALLLIRRNGFGEDDGDKGVSALAHHDLDGILQGITILVQEAINSVGDGGSVVVDTEGVFA